jgi:hypothetical protein
MRYELRALWARANTVPGDVGDTGQLKITETG